MKNWDTISDSEKEILAISAINNLINMLDGDNDFYKKILLEEFFRFIFEYKSEEF